MPDAPATQRSFADLATASARLITCEEPPDLDDLDSGDMVICGDDWGIEQYTAEAAARGIHVRHGRYRYQCERIIAKTAKRRMVIRGYTPLSGTDSETPGHSEKDSIEYATDAFAQAWDALSTEPDTEPRYEAASDHVPAPWLAYLPFPTLNPAQAQGASHLVDSDQSVIVTAPTGAGKTVIGMMAVLRAILSKGKKAAWLVPQRSLTAELDRELDEWRGQGLKVVALSGETATDTEKTRDADLWVATTEKFEALCRSSSMRETIEQIDTIVVDEIHLLGDPSRGAVLETLLARVGAERLPVRIVGLSATAANAASVANWLGATLVPIAWRPTRQTSQVLMVPADSANADSRTRNNVVAQIVSDVTLDDGSTIIFCGTKAKVRSTALAIARARGINVSTIDPADAAAVYEATHAVGVGLHYSDWPQKRQAEKEFREHASDVLVATSTLAAGVNLPARVVIIRDTTIGQQNMEVSMVQQMCGRAGRAGKEPEGWSLILGDPHEIAHWRKQLAEGYTIRSGLARSLPDHLLGEIVQGNVQSTKGASQWWENTFAHHEGENGSTVLRDALETLTKFGFADTEQAAADPSDQTLITTRLGQITSRMMVSVADARNLIMAMRGKKAPPTPRSANQAEEALASVVADSVWALVNAQSANAEQAPRVRSVLDAKGYPRDSNSGRSAINRNGRDTLTGKYVSEAGLLLALRNPRALAARGGQVLGINRALLGPALYDSPRIFAWVAAVGPLRVLPAWASVVALDMGPRITWHHLMPSRGEGRLLAACERAAPRARGAQLVPALLKEARNANAETPPRLASAQPPDGVSASRLRDVAAKSARITDGTFGAGVAATVLTAEGAWAAMPAGEPLRGRLAAAFHPSGDATGTLWLDMGR